MIEVSVKEVEGVKFLSNIRILEPDGKVNGVGVHRISKKLHDLNPNEEFFRAIKLMGLHKVDYDPSWRAYLYAQFPLSVWRYKVVKLLLGIYWRAIYFLYVNARFFQQIPDSAVFSWYYFTPFAWFRTLKRRLAK